MLLKDAAERDDRGQGRRFEAADAAAGLCRGKGQERDHPGADALNLPAMRDVAADIADRRPVGEDEPEALQETRPRRSDLRLLGRHQQQHQEARDQRSHRRHGKRQPPARMRRDDAGDQIGTGEPEPRQRHVTGRRPRLQLFVDAVRQRLQAGHEDPGKPDPEQRLRDQRADKAVGKDREPGRSACRHHRGDEIDAARVDAVGDAGQQRHRRDIAEEQHAADQPRLRRWSCPRPRANRQQRGIGREPSHAQDFRDAHHRREAGAVQPADHERASGAGAASAALRAAHECTSTCHDACSIGASSLHKGCSSLR